MPIQDQSEIYTPDTAAAPTGSLGRSMVGMAGQVMLDRSATIHRSMRWGASRSQGFAQTFFGLRHTENELNSFGGHSTNIFGVKWRDKFWNSAAGKPLGKAMGLDGRTSLMGTPWAPSSWAMSMDLAKNPTAYNHSVLNVSKGLPYTQDVRKVIAEGKSPTMGTWRQYKGFDPRGEKLSAEEAHLAINNFLKVGSQAKGANVVRDYTLGKMFDANAGYTASEAFIGKSAFKGAYGGTTMRSGAAMAEHGGAAIAGASKWGAATYGAYMAAGTLLRAYTWYSVARDVSKATYKGLEAYYYKAPMAAYSAVGRQLTRGNFSSGDAAMLTGIPANNRMRAVQAIQGSRMNARSALGGEATLLAGHFG